MISILFILIISVLSIPNPAAVYCTKVGMKSNSLHTKQGNYAVCETESGKFVDAWKLLRSSKLKQGDIKLQFISVDGEGNIIKGEEVNYADLVRH